MEWENEICNPKMYGYISTKSPPPSEPVSPVSVLPPSVFPPWVLPPSVFPGFEPPPGLSPLPVPPGLVPPPFGSLSGSSTSPLSPEVTFFTTLPLRSMQVICIGVLCSSSHVRGEDNSACGDEAACHLTHGSHTLGAHAESHSSQTWDSYGVAFG